MSALRSTTTTIATQLDQFKQLVVDYLSCFRRHDQDQDQNDAPLQIGYPTNFRHESGHSPMRYDMAGVPVITSRTALVETRYTPFTDSVDDRPIKPPHALRFQSSTGDDENPRTSTQTQTSGQLSTKDSTAKLKDHRVEEMDEGETDSEPGKGESETM